MLRNAFPQQRMQKSRVQVASAVATNTLGSTVRTLLLVTLLAPRIQRRILDFWKICVPLLARIATGWTVRGSNPGWGGIFRTRPNRPWGPPSLVYNVSRVFHGGKAAGTWR